MALSIFLGQIKIEQELVCQNTSITYGIKKSKKKPDAN